MRLEKAIAEVEGVVVLHRTSDADHNRSVITYAGGAEPVVEAAVRAAAVACDLIDLTRHRGVHPRLGALEFFPSYRSREPASQTAWNWRGAQHSASGRNLEFRCTSIRRLRSARTACF